MTNQSVAIYFNKTMLQLVVLKKGFGRPKLADVDFINTPAGLDINSKEQQTANIIEIFGANAKNLLKKHKIRTGQVVTTALPPEFIAIRYFQMPRLAVREYKTAVPFEALKYLPYKLEDITYAYTISHEKVASNKMAVTFVAAEKTSVTNYINFLQDIGLKVGYLEAVPYSLMRFFYHTREIEGTQTASLIHIGAESANINIIKNNVLYLTRNVVFSAKADNTFGEPASDNLLTEIRLSFDYFHRQFPDEKIEKMVIWSDSPQIHNFCQRASKELNILVKAANPFGAFEGSKVNSAEYAIGCGLALRGLHELKEDINLSPGFKKIESQQLTRLVVFEGCLALAVLFMFYTVDSGKVKILQRQLDEQASHGPAAASNIKNLSNDNLRRTKVDMQAKLESLKAAVEDRMSVISKLDRISHLLPEGLWLDEFYYTRPKGSASQVLTLIGYAYKSTGEDQIKVVNKFLEDLKNDNLFSSGFSWVKLDSISNVTYNNMQVNNFKISCIRGEKD